MGQGTKDEQSFESDANDGAGDVTKVVLDLEVAEEVVELIEDKPGEADEDALDDALDALAAARRRVPARDQLRAAKGAVVAIEVSSDTKDAVELLINDDVATKERALRRFGQRLRSKVQKARRKSRRPRSRRT